MDRTQAIVRKLIWIYLLLFVFEGAIRKWLLPSLAGPMLFARDALVLQIVYYAWKGRLFPKSQLMQWGVAISVLCVIFGLLALPSSPLVAVAGLRAGFLHFPLILLAPTVLTSADLQKMIRFLLVLSVPMAILMALQYQAGSGSWLNAGAGADAKQIGGFLDDKVRASGTFSFVSGSVSYFMIVSGLVFGCLLSAIKMPKLIVVASAISCVIAVAVSGSRGFIASEAVSLVMTALLLPIINRKYFGLSVKLIVALLTIVVGTMFLPAFQEGWKGTGTRLENTGKGTQDLNAEVNQRVFADYTGAFDLIDRVPITGYGYGIITNVGSTILFGRPYSPFGLDGEREWGRHVLESGPILGLMVIAFRIAMVIALLRYTYYYARRGNVLPFIILTTCITSLLNGQLKQPSILGGIVVSGALILTAAQPLETSKDNRRK